MTDYTPTTEQVRRGYSIDPEAEYRDPLTNHTKIHEREFDRWLTNHDHASKARFDRERALNLQALFIIDSLAGGMPDTDDWKDVMAEHERAIREVAWDAGVDYVLSSGSLRESDNPYRLSPTKNGDTP